MSILAHNNLRNNFRTGWPWRVVLFLFAILFLLVTGGCGGKVSRVHYAEDYNPIADDSATYAMGGFVLGTLAELDRQAEIGSDEQNADLRYQTDVWSPILYGPFLAVRNGSQVWSWSALRENIPVDTITQAQLAFSRGEVLQPSLLSLVAADLPEVQYIVFARIDENEISIGRMLPESHTNSDVEHDNDLPGGNSLLNSAKSRRTVKVTLEVYDLQGGRSVWRGDVKREQTELMGSDAMTTEQELMVTPATEEDGLPDIEVNSASVRFPALEDLLADACAALVSNLFQSPEDGEQDE